jgi:hypothetical protein
MGRAKRGHQAATAISPGRPFSSRIERVKVNQALRQARTRMDTFVRRVAAGKVQEMNIPEEDLQCLQRLQSSDLSSSLAFDGALGFSNHLENIVPGPQLTAYLRDRILAQPSVSSEGSLFERAQRGLIVQTVERLRTLPDYPTEQQIAARYLANLLEPYQTILPPISPESFMYLSSSHLLLNNPDVQAFYQHTPFGHLRALVQNYTQKPTTTPILPSSGKYLDLHNGHHHYAEFQGHCTPERIVFINHENPRPAATIVHELVHSHQIYENDDSDITIFLLEGATELATADIIQISSDDYSYTQERAFIRAVLNSHLHEDTTFQAALRELALTTRAQRMQKVCHLLFDDDSQHAQDTLAQAIEDCKVLAEDLDKNLSDEEHHQQFYTIALRTIKKVQASLNS